MFKGENCKQPFNLEILGGDEILTMFPTPMQIRAAKNLDDIKLKKISYFQIDELGKDYLDLLACGEVIKHESNRGAFILETNTIKSPMIRCSIDLKHLKPSY